MNLFEIKNWNTETHGPLSLDAIKKLHQPSEKYRISEKTLPVGDIVHGTAKEGLCYVIQGELVYYCEASSKELELKQNNFSLLPSGNYEYRIGRIEPVILVRVWKLPF